MVMVWVGVVLVFFSDNGFHDGLDRCVALFLM